MPKGFSDKEKNVILGKLIDVGKEMFGHYGFKKVSIDEVVRHIKISKGTFYLFFDSKESYFMEVLESLDKENRKSLLSIIEDKTLSPEKRLKAYLLKGFEFMEKNPVMTKIKYQDMEALMLNLPGGKVQDHINSDMDFMLNFLTDLQAESGRTVQISHESLSGFFQFFFYIFLHKDDIGDTEYHAGVELMLDMACRYFFGGKDGS